MDLSFEVSRQGGALSEDKFTDRKYFAEDRILAQLRSHVEAGPCQ